MICKRLLLNSVLLMLPACGGSEPPGEIPAVPPAARDSAAAQAAPAPAQSEPAFQPEPLPEQVRSFCVLPRRVAAAPPAAPAPAGEAVAFERVRGGGGTPELPLRCVVRTWREWERLAAHAGLHGFDQVTPDTFRGSILIFASMGEQPTGGSSQWIVSMVSVNGGLVVRVRSDLPADNELTTQGLTYPFNLARVDDQFPKVVFEEE